MKKSYLALAPAVFAIFLMAPAASAQTPVNITVVSGNGQLVCPLCPLQGANFPTTFDGLYVKVTDANGNPVSGASVTWNVSGQGILGSNSSTSDTTTTNAQGIASETFLLFSQNTSTIGNAYNQSAITASITNGNAVTFYETATFANITGQGNSPAPVQVQLLTPSSFPPCATCISPGDTIKGNAGSTSTVQFKVQVYAQGTSTPVVPNVSLRLVPNQNSPTISCATGSGADPGSVLTDMTGSATCTAVFGSTTGFGSFYVLVGGVASVGYNVGGPAQGYFQSGNFNMNVLPGVASSILVVSGNNQSGNPGQAVGPALVAQVSDASGNPLSGQAVVWSVTPSGAATLSNTTTTSGSNGQVQTNVALASTSSGQVQVKVALASNPSVSATFTVTANVQLTGLQFLSSNNQTVLVNSSTPITVQLSAGSGQTTSNVNVNFTLTGPATLSATSATTNASGQATVTVVSGAATGVVTITASAGGQTATSTLTVIPTGPSLTTGSFYNGADFQAGSLSPCSIATIIAPGVAPALQGVATGFTGVGGLPYALAGDQVMFNGAPSPIFNVANVNGMQQITFQVPCSVTPGNVPVVLNVGGGSSTVTIPVKPASPGLFLTGTGSAQVPVLERPDGSFVSATNPAHRGEQLIAYVTGLGPTTPSVATNDLPAPGSNPTIQGTIIVGIDGNGAPLMSSAISTDLVGVETVTFVVPTTIAAGTATFSIGVLYPSSGSTVYYSGLGMFPVQ